jgi:hypothetical protein
MGQLRFYNVGDETTAPAPPPTPAPLPVASKGSNIPIDELLQAGVQIGTTVTRQRAASGKSASRQARIAACGRKPLFGKKKKAAYNECLANAEAGVDAATRSGDFPPPPSSDGGGSNTMMYVGIGLGVIVLGVVGFVLYRKFNK